MLFHRMDKPHMNFSKSIQIFMVCQLFDMLNNAAMNLQVHLFCVGCKFPFLLDS